MMVGNVKVIYKVNETKIGAYSSGSAAFNNWKQGYTYTYYNAEKKETSFEAFDYNKIAAGVLNEDRAEHYIKTTIFKTDSSFSKNLSGAEFELYREINGSKTRITFNNEIKSVISAGNIEFIDANRERGIALNLEFGKTYYFKETKAPKGHVLKKIGYLQVKVAKDGAVSFGYDGDWSKEDIQFVPTGELTETREATLKIKNDTWVCKLTDGTDHLLYQDSDGSKPAVYTTLEAGFEAAGGTLYTKEGSPFSITADIRLKLLRDYELSAIIKNDNQRALTLTTAEQSATAAMQEAGDEYTFTPGQVPAITGTYNTATVQRKFNGDSMFSNKSELTLTAIVLDGGKNAFSAGVNGGIMNVSGSNANLNVLDDARLINARTTANGGAVYVSNGGTMTMTGGSITGNDAVNGAGIYLAQGSKLNLSGDHSFSNNVSDVALSENAKNGGEGYIQARQDIYLEGTGEPLSSITLTGNLEDVAPGSIWVWAEGTDNTQPNHYYMLKQFAVLADDFTGKW